MPAGAPASQERSLRVRVGFSFAILSITGGLATLGYYLLWRAQGGSFLDAAYMTVITMTTIGFAEVRPLDTAGRLLTMGTAVVGVGSLFYLMTALMEYLVAAQISGRREERRMEKEIAKLSEHIIVAGLGRVGRQACIELKAAKLPFVVIDPSEQALEFARENELLHVHGDSATDEVLDRAGIQRARGLIVTTDSDATNLYVVISARLRNPKLRIVSRAVDEASIPKLKRAGADQAINPYAIGGKRLAHLISSPYVVDFLETALTRGNQALGIQEIAIPPEAPVVGKPLGSMRAEEGGASIMAVVRAGNPLVNPPATLALEAGDRILALGTAEQLERLERRVGGAG